jgi:serine/threonine-protein kinase
LPTSVLSIVAIGLIYMRDGFGGAGYSAAAPLGVIVASAISAGVLASGKLGTRLALRLIELVVFGGLAAFVFARTHAHLVSAGAAGDVSAALGAWHTGLLSMLVLIGAYNMFIPNTLVRGAAVSCALGIVPFATVTYARADEGIVRATVDAAVTSSAVTTGAMIMVVGVLIATVGGFFINLFRNLAVKEKDASMYSLHQKIGEGGMGEVWLAHHHRLARPVALKLIRPDKLETADAAKLEILMHRFEREAQTTAKLRSPNTVEVYDYGVAGNGVFYYVMEYLDGVDLDTLVTRYGPVDPGRAVFLLRQACDSLADAHVNDFVHRDIKPANLYVTRLGLSYDFVKVLDFGLVKPVNGDATDVRLSADGHTQGTPAFMPPEIAVGADDVDARSDIYALGCVAYWMLTGDLVFQGDTAMKLAVAHATETPVAPSQRTELDIPEDLDQVVLRCLAKKPEDRFQSAEELSSALKGVPIPTRWDRDHAKQWWQTHQPG